MRTLDVGERVRGIANLTNALSRDVVFLLGDFAGGHQYVTAPVMPDEWGGALSVLKAPLGVYAVLGNHDWWHGPLPSMPADGAEGAPVVAFGRHRSSRKRCFSGVEGRPAFWIAGLGDQLGEMFGPRRGKTLADLPGTLVQIKDSAPVILLAHEPNIFRQVPSVSLTLCGHTHGGQVNLPFTETFVRTHFRVRQVYGHVVEKNRHMIISAGLGTSNVPVRFNRRRKSYG